MPQPLPSSSPVDLHCHSTCSDGEWPPARVVAAAAAAGVRVLALTDHDTVDGLAEAREAAREHGIRLVDGIELSVELPAGPRRPAEELHVLGYFVDPGSGELRARLQQARGERERRNEALLARLRALGAPVSAEAVGRIAGRAPVGRPHLARALVEAGHAADVFEAFERYLSERGAAYVERERIGAAAGIALLRRAGAVPVLAHPAAYSRVPGDQWRGILAELKAAGLAGVEALHSGHTREQRRRFSGLARGLDLVVTGGSDFHGPTVLPGVHLGSGWGGLHVPLEVVDALESRRPRPAAPPPPPAAGASL
ncbi:PHP domain-containing protein [Myxococcota bacterium]|nr:PHP domain-containing protein [Myxococcota bacterium]